MQTDVQPLMAGGLNAPLAAAQEQDLQRAEPVGWTAGDEIGAHRGGFAFFGAGPNNGDQLGRPGQSQLHRGDLPYDYPALDAAPAIFLTQAINLVKRVARCLLRGKGFLGAGFWLSPEWSFGFPLTAPGNRRRGKPKDHSGDSQNPAPRNPFPLRRQRA